MNPITAKKLSLLALGWDEYFSELPKWLSFKKSVNVRELPYCFGSIYFCSYYVDIDDHWFGVLPFNPLK